MALLTHLAPDADWAGRGNGEFRPKSLDREGFVHLSTAEQVGDTARRYYAGRRDVRLVYVDSERLDDVRFEAPASTTAPHHGLFPHLYGPLPLAAVLDTDPLTLRKDGNFLLPRRLWQLALDHGSPGRFSVPMVGVVEGGSRALQDKHWGPIKCRIRIRHDLQAGLVGLGGFSHVVVVTYLDGAHFEASRHLQRRPRGRSDMPSMGIFAQRAKDRPAPIGVSVARIHELGLGYVEVSGLDAIDGTPVLDLKPYFRQFDRVEEVETPEWVDELMEEYF